MNRLPVSTYRLQLQPSFGFHAARDAVDYLDALGVTDAYTSPPFAAESGSTHGYNLVDHGRLNPELGTPEEFDELAATLAARGMGLVVDFVPNHMGIGADANPWWNDVLENGPSSRYADTFDIDWSPPKESLAGHVLLPILGSQYGETLEQGDIQVERDGGRFLVRYYERHLPVRPKSLVGLLTAAAERSGLGQDDPERQELESIVLSISVLPPPADRSDAAREIRAREKEVVRRRLGELFERSPAMRDAVDAVVAELNGRRGDPASFDALDALLREQVFRLSSWQVATAEINYRRFFDVHGLAAIRMELPQVFDATHGLVLELCGSRRVTGLRLDHTDGLYDPAGYFDTLQERLARATGTEPGAAGGRPFYVVAEKILGAREELPRSWKVHGTTGYDFTAAITGVLVDTRSERLLTRLYQTFTGEDASFDETVDEAKRIILRSTLSAELNQLARRLERIAEANRRSRDFTLGSLARAIFDTLVGFRVYRTYVRPDGQREPADEAEVRGAIARARRWSREMPGQVLSFLGDVLLLANGAQSEEERAARVEFAMRFQQVSGPVMAKAVEDTAFYRFDRFVALNEVGSDPARFGLSVADFHAFNRARAASWPLSMSATATHDTKRGEDVRARLAVLSEMPEQWRRAVRRWARLARRHKTLVDGEPAPSRNDEYLFYQTVVGALPLVPGESARFTDRIAAYMLKATREAKRETSWVNPRPEYEAALERFVRELLGDARFAAAATEFCDALAPYGATNGLAQTLLRLCAPGVADTYQGSELWDQRLVDPDNRAPVDFARLRSVLDGLAARRDDRLALARSLLDDYRNGAIKLYVLSEGLRARRDHPTLFQRGSYEPLGGPEHVLGFARRETRDLAVCAVPLLAYRLTQGRAPWPLGAVWGDERLQMPSDGRYRNVLTGEVLEVGRHARLADVFASFPVALLVHMG